MYLFSKCTVLDDKTRHVQLILKITTTNKFDYKYSKVKVGSTEFFLVNVITRPFKPFSSYRLLANSKSNNILELYTRYLYAYTCCNLLYFQETIISGVVS